MRHYDSSEPKFPNRGWAGVHLRKWISKTFRKKPPVNKPPSFESMEALRQKYPPKGKRS